MDSDTDVFWVWNSRTSIHHFRKIAAVLSRLPADCGLGMQKVAQRLHGGHVVCTPFVLGGRWPKKSLAGHAFVIIEANALLHICIYPYRYNGIWRAPMIRHDGALKSAVVRDTEGKDNMGSSIRRQPSQDSVFLAWTFDSLTDAVDAAVQHASGSRSAGDVAVVMRLVSGEFPDSNTLRKLEAAQVELVSTAEDLVNLTVVDVQILNEVRQLLSAPKPTVTWTAPALTDGETVKVGPDKRPSKDERQKFVDEEVYGRHLAY